MAVRFQYELPGAGWSACTLEVDQASVKVTASYLSDALRSLLSALCRILTGETESTASFDEEPGEYRWKFYRLDEHRLKLVILEFDELWSHEPDSDGKCIFDIEYRIRPIADAIYDGCKILLALHGRDGYKAQWLSDDFPDEEFSQLGRLLCKKRS
jgi:hypothetical protein